MKVLVTGANGQLGSDVVKNFINSNIECLGVDKEDFDITNEVATKEYINKYNPDVLIHCAAYTNVNKAENEKQLCFNINVLGTRYIAKACREINAKLVYISTDYVFDGKSEKPYEVSDLPNPINYYGQCKYEGELEVIKLVSNYYILRTSWMFGTNGNNFVNTMINIAKTKSEILVVDDQFGSPTYTVDLSKFIIKLIKTNEYGIYHITNEGYCSWYEFAVAIFKQLKTDIKVNKTTSSNFKTIAKRPSNSRLQSSSAINVDISKLPTWEDGLKRYLQEKNNFEK